MSIWTKDLFELAAERARAKLQAHPRLSRKIKATARFLDRTLEPVARQLAGLISGTIFGLFWGLLLGILWAPAGTVVGILAFFSGWKIGVAYQRVQRENEEPNWWDEDV